MTKVKASRTKWSTKKKAQALTVMTMLFLIAVIILLPKAMAYEDPKHCYGSECYYIGYNRGTNDAYNDYWSNTAYNSACPDNHSDAYCNGYEAGYSHSWMYQYHEKHPSISQSTDQNSNIRIDGNGNRVVVNQGASNSNGGSDGSSGGSSSGHGYQPRCTILCSIIKVG